MTSLQLLKVNKDAKDIIITVLTNIVRMLTERNLLKRTNLDQNIKTVTSSLSDNMIYTIKLDNVSSKDDNICAVKYFSQKITSVSKTSPINDFLNKYKNNPKIIVVLSVSTKAENLITSHPKSEIFVERNLMMNLIDHILVPKHELLSPADAALFFSQYNCKKRNASRISSNDPIARYYNMKPGDVCRIIRPSETAGHGIFYRFVKKGL